MNEVSVFKYNQKYAAGLLAKFRIIFRCSIKRWWKVAFKVQLWSFPTPNQSVLNLYLIKFLENPNLPVTYKELFTITSSFLFNLSVLYTITSSTFLFNSSVPYKVPISPCDTNFIGCHITPLVLAKHQSLICRDGSILSKNKLSNFSFNSSQKWRVSVIAASELAYQHKLFPA